ncbi:MAG: hypothetical protein ABJA82_10990, partial [Myxococcales bacterium]
MAEDANFLPFRCETPTQVQETPDDFGASASSADSEDSEDSDVSGRKPAFRRHSVILEALPCV